VTGRLSRLQEDVLHAFFRRESRFFLTGGAALSGYHLGHRGTEDLDLFTTSPVLDEGEAALREAAHELGATVEAIQTSPTFRRRLVRRGEETVIVDLVLDETVQGHPSKPRQGAVVVDPPEEILANKLCALLSRAEIRDLVDICFLDRAGFPIEPAMTLASRKDGSMSPAQLAWVLSQIKIGDDAAIPGEVGAAELRTFLADLERRLARLSWPER
jgi:hypothetical protein